MRRTCHHSLVCIRIVIACVLLGGCVSPPSPHEPSDEPENSIDPSSGPEDVPVKIIPGGVLCARGRPINIRFLIDKDSLDQLARGDSRIRLIQKGTGNVVREEKIDLTTADREASGGKICVWVPDVLKAPPVSFQANPVNSDPLPTGTFYIQLVQMRGEDSFVVGQSPKIEIISHFR